MSGLVSCTGVGCSICRFWDGRVALGAAPSFASSIPSGVASAIPSVALSVASSSGGFARPLPVYPVTSVAPSMSSSLPFSMASLLAPSHPPTLPLAPVSSSATLTSSQPLVPVASVSLGSGGGGAWFQGRRLLMRIFGVVCLSWIRLGCMWTL